MNVSLKIASRYLFSKKSHSAINIVSIISVCGVAVGTMALVCVLSVYNGFQGVIEGLFSNFDPQIRIESTVNKSFDPQALESIKGMPEVECLSYIIEENALLKFRDKQLPVRVKGVEDNYGTLTNIAAIMVQGEFSLHEGNFCKAVLGAGLAGNIGSGVYIVDPIHLYAPKREGNISIIRPDHSFNEITAFPSGSFMVRQEKYDNSLVIIPIAQARELFEYESEITSADIKLKKKADERKFIKRVQTELGSDFQVLDRYAQQKDFYRMMEVEKWITYLILSFILMIAAFNIIGSLSMLIIEKKDDIQTLSHLGLDGRGIFRVFFYDGCITSLIGVLAGIVMGLVLCWLQYKFEFITMGSGGTYIVNAYPVKVCFTDILIIFATVMGLGCLASYFTSKQV